MKTKTLLFRAVIALGMIGLPAACTRAADPNDKNAPQVKEEYLKKIEAALPEKAPAQPKQKRKVLIFTLATGFVHSSIPVGAKALQLMGEKTGAYESTISNDPEMFEPDRLKDFDAVVMVSTTGELFGYPQNADTSKLPAEKKEQNDKRRQGLMEFIQNGKGLVGIHAAGDCSYKWPWYGETIGGYFNGHPWQHVAYKIDDPNSPLTAMFKGKQFTIDDETYTFRDPWSREKLHVLASIDLPKSDMKPDPGNPGKMQGENRADHDYGLSWIHQVGKGRVFYAAHGHREEIYWNPTMLQHYLAGIQYACGDLESDATPSGKEKESGK